MLPDLQNVALPARSTGRVPDVAPTGKPGAASRGPVAVFPITAAGLRATFKNVHSPGLTVTG